MTIEQEFQDRIILALINLDLALVVTREEVARKAFERFYKEYGHDHVDKFFKYEDGD